MTKQGDKVLDDSRKWDRHMELVFGKKFKLEVWETCIQTMAMNEVASFKVKSFLAAPYPVVAKTIRDTFSKVRLFLPFFFLYKCFFKIFLI